MTQQSARRPTSHQQSAAVSVTTRAEQLSYQSPIPPPEVLVKYETILPGSMDRILTMAEKQSDHRRALEAYVTHADVRRANWGLVAGTAVALGFGWFSYQLGLNGHEWLGGVLGGGTIVSLVGAFIYGTQSRKNEREDRARVMAGQEHERLQ